MMIATFDDDQEELMETFTSFSFYAFLGVFVYFLYRYSIHYFSFLASSDTKRESLSLFSQFAVDFLDTVGLLLRFIVLMARLNLYDFLDDLLDSYYIFVCDFDDDEYFSDYHFSFFMASQKEFVTSRRRHRCTICGAAHEKTKTQEHTTAAGRMARTPMIKTQKKGGV